MVAPAFNSSQFLAQVLQSLGGGLQNYGSGGNFSQGFQGGMQNAQQAQDSALRRQAQEQQLALTEEEAAARRTENQRKAEAAKRWEQMFAPDMAGVPMVTGNAAPPANAGFSGARLDDGAVPMQTASAPPDNSLMASLPENVRRALQALGPDQGPGALAQYLMREPKEREPGKSREIHRNGMIVDQEFDANTGKWSDVGQGPQFAPPQPREPGKRSIVTLYSPKGEAKSVYDDDPSIPGLLQSGWVDDKPSGGTALVQTGVDDKGQPIYEMVSKAGGKPSESNIQAGLRGTLVKSAVDSIRKITTEEGTKINAMRMAAADTIGEKGPMGAYGANLLRTDDEKKYSASIAKGVEGLVAAITGAGVAIPQFPRIQQLIPGPTDGPEIVNWKLDQLQPILDELLAGSGVVGIAGMPQPNAAQSSPDGGKVPADMTDDEIKKALGQ